MIIPETDHPWGKFLNARAEALKWSRDEMGYNITQLTRQFSMDEMQVKLILMQVDEQDQKVSE